MRSLCTMKPLSTPSVRPSDGGHVVGVGVAAEPVVGLEQGDGVRVARSAYAAVSPETPEPITATVGDAGRVLSGALSGTGSSVQGLSNV